MNSHRISLLLAALLVPWASALAAPIVIPTEPEHVLSLDGTWRFKLEQPGDVTTPHLNRNTLPPITTPATFEPFYAPDYREGTDWHDLQVPGNWEMAGFSPATYHQPDNASAFYRLWFKVPADWQHRRVLVNFDAVQNGAEVFCNGQPVNVTESSWGKANYHEGGWLPFQADVTDLVRCGTTNLLALRVTKNTKSADLDSGDYFFLGGLHRSVTLFSVPAVAHLDDLTIQTQVLPDGSGRVKVLADLTSLSSAPLTLSVQLGDFPPLEAQDAVSGHVELVQPVAHPKLWSAEHPNLYALRVQLKDKAGEVVETVNRRVGIREVSIENGLFCVNHVPVKLTGICRHDLAPTLGTAANADLWRKDITLAKAANVNAIRTSHYPYGPGFYDLCDELGIYVMDELPYCWSPNNNYELAPAYEQRARETIRRDKNRTCVLLWGIGNEGVHGTNFQIVADLVKRLDPTRPRIVTQAAWDKYHTELSDSHYTKPTDMAKAAAKARRDGHPHIYLECPNVWDIRLGANHGADAACWDLWEEVLRRCWDVVWANDSIPGAFLWEWQDRCVADKCPIKLDQFDPATGIQYLKIKGVVDGFRHPRPQYYHVKMIYSPIKLGAQLKDFSPQSAVFMVTNLYSFTDLSELALNWTLLKADKTIASGTNHIPLAPRTCGYVGVSFAGSSLQPAGPGRDQADTLQVDFIHPDGRHIVSHQFTLPVEPLSRPAATLSPSEGEREGVRGAGATMREPVRAMLTPPPADLPFPRLNLVVNRTENDKVLWRRATRFHGVLTNITQGTAFGKEALDVRPPAKLQSLQADVVLDNNPTNIVAHLLASWQNDSFTYVLNWKGPKSDIQELGWEFTMPHRCDHFSWKRQALWSVYPPDHIGRPQGTATPDSAKGSLLDWSRPDAFDFTSTKYHCDWAALTDSQHQGLRVEFAPDQRHHCRAGFGARDAYTLVVNKHTSPPRDISSNEVPDLYLTLSAGDQVDGAFRIGSTAR